MKFRESFALQVQPEPPAWQKLLCQELEDGKVIQSKDETTFQKP